jgi:hypothetical protein
LQIEGYVDLIKDNKLRIPIIELTIRCASADGLDIKENIGFQKLIALWDIDLKRLI